MVAFVALRVLYVVVLRFFRFRLSCVSLFSLLNPFLAAMSFAGYFHARFLLSAFSLFFFFGLCSFPVGCVISSTL